MTGEGRSIEVVLGLQGREGYLIQSDPVALRPIGTHPLAIDFKVSYKTDGKPPKGNLTVFGPPQQAVSDLLSGERAFVRISAGYDGRVSQIFSGEPIRDGSTADVQPNQQTRLTVEALGGAAKYREARVGYSRRGRVSVRQAVEDIARDAGLSITRNDIPADLAYASGLVRQGDAFDVLMDLAQVARVEFVLLGDTVEFVDVWDVHGTPTAMVSAPLFSSVNGSLVGRSSITDSGLKFRTLITEPVFPGQQAVVEERGLGTTDLVRRRVLVREVTFSGTNVGNEFFMDIAGKVLG